MSKLTLGQQFTLVASNPSKSSCSVALIFGSICYVLSNLPPVIDSIAAGFTVVAEAITNSLLKLATPEMVLGIMGLAGAFWMLAGALVAVGTAGLVAAPALAIVTGFTAAMTALGMAGNAKDKQKQENDKNIADSLDQIELYLKTLSIGFGDAKSDGAYLTTLGTKMGESEKAGVKELVRLLPNVGKRG